MNNNKNNILLTMESLDLPKELFWEMKLEPASPPTAAASELFALDEPTVNFLYDDNFANGITLLSADDMDSLQEASMELPSDEDLVVEFFNLKDEECLFDQKAPHYVEYETISYAQPLGVESQDILALTKVQDATDFQHVDTSFTLQQLTPPQSPPHYDGQQQQQQQLELVKEEPKLQSLATDAAVSASTGAVATAYNFNNWTPGSEIAREIQLVDEIVNMRAQELQLPTNWQQLNDDCESQSSSSLSSSDTSAAGSSIADADEDWLPESLASSPAHTSSNEEQVTSGISTAATKKRTRAYGRGVEDRKIRKKEQNKNAATRYRQKKKIEMEHVLGEEQQLMQANEQLRRTLAERRHESRYLRQLIREFYQERKK